MIKQNRRVPGTINSTPIAKFKQPFPNQNQTLPIEPATCHNYALDQSYDWKRETTSWKQRTLQQRYQNDEHRLIELDISEKGISDMQKSLDFDIKFTSVSVLNLANNLLCTLPANIFNKLSNLTKLYLNGNRIDKISFPYFKENKLKIIDISNNKLKNLNLQHIDSLIKLNCSSNQLSFLTLPSIIQFLNCASNKLSNIYFMEHCHLLEEVSIADNLLYDLKFNFKPYIKFKDDDFNSINAKAYLSLRSLDCSCNKIQFIEGMELTPNLKVLLLSNNQICLTRHILNQLFLLQHLQNLDFENNPLEGSGLTQAEILNTVISRMPSLLTINGEDICDMNGEEQGEGYETERKTHFSGINEQPYQIFMDSHQKVDKDRPVFDNAEWNFTLGDCDNEAKDSSKIHQLSQIQVINHCDALEPQFLQQKGAEQSPEKLVKTDLEQTYHFGLLNKHDKQIKLKVFKSTAPLIPHHVFYQEFLNALLPMSYIPACSLPRGADLTSGRRLDNQDDEYVLISRMFENRGGVTYIKKVNRWNILENGRQIFSKNGGDSGQSGIGFLLNDLSQAQFRQLSKFNKLVRRGQQDIIGMQPNAFTYFHILVRSNPYNNEEFYQCAYFIETAQL